MPAPRERGEFARDDWQTPPEVMAQIRSAIPIDLDVCANRLNTQAEQWYGPGGIRRDGLTAAWHGVCYMNPPYGVEVRQWVEKAAMEWKTEACTVIGLLAARTDTVWFQKYVARHAHLYFIKGRLRFVGAPHPAPFPSVVALWEGGRLNIDGGLRVHFGPVEHIGRFLASTLGG